MFKALLACCVKVNGKVMREFNDKIFLPFQSNYSIFIKNMNNRRVKVNVLIDGKIVINNLMIDSNSFVDLERFHEGNDEIGHKFRFIEKTEKVVEHRGNEPYDGIISIQYCFEKEKEVESPTWIYNNKTFYVKYNDYHLNKSCDDNSNINLFRPMFDNSLHADYSSDKSINDGITVNGPPSHQKFKSNISFVEYEDFMYIMNLKLCGENIVKEITVEDKLKCKTCGTKNNYNFKFCYECGTYLK